MFKAQERGEENRVIKPFIHCVPAGSQLISQNSPDQREEVLQRAALTALTQAGTRTHPEPQAGTRTHPEPRPGLEPTQNPRPGLELTCQDTNPARTQIGAPTHVPGLEPNQKPDWDLNPWF